MNDKVIEDVLSRDRSFYVLKVVIVPCGIGVNTTDAEKKSIYDSCGELEQSLKSVGVRVKGDYRDNYSPGWKFNHWELKVN